MKQILTILIISLFSLSCERREIVVLNRENAELKSRCDSLTEIINLLKDKPCLNHIKYYIIASEKSLLENGVIVRVSGLSREMKINNRLNKKYFITQHIELIDTLLVEGKDVKVIGQFHPDSYIITEANDENHHFVIIKNRNLFWNHSRYLVITHK